MLSISYYDGVKYHSSEFMNRDKDFFGNGVVQATHFPYTLPTPNNMTLSIGAGVAWVDGYRIGNDSNSITLTVPTADPTNPRIDIVQIGHDDINSQAVLTVKKGIAASTPIEPDADPNYVKLYAINVPANATSISASNITDKRLLVPLNVSGTQISMGGSAGTGQKNTFTDTQTFSNGSAPINIPSQASLPPIGPKDTLCVVNGTWYRSDGTNWNAMAPAAPVTSVNSKTGAVSLTASDVGAYVKPAGGIPKTDLETAVQTSLGKADSALQSVPSASTTQAGIVELSSSVTSTDETTAATPNAVKTVNDSLAAHTADYVKHPGYATTTGTANTYAVTLNPAPTAYVDGMGIVAKINVASTGASTINVNGLGAKTIKDSLGNDITSGGLKLNTPYTLRYEATSGNFIVQGKGGGGNAGAGDLLSGKTATVDSGQITGTMPNNGTFNLGLGVAVPAGYYSGGTTANGKRFASGTTTSSAGTSNYYLANGTTAALYSVTVTGLSFIPSKIIIMYRNTSAGYSGITEFDNNPLFTSTNAKILLAQILYGQGTQTVDAINAQSPVSVTSTGFTLPFLYSGLSVDWIAYE